MTENDFSTIKPVENLPNVAGLTPTGQRQERKRRPNAPRPSQKPDAKSVDEAAEQETPERDQDVHMIDYRA